ncbi:MAG: hypothetical protein V4450_06560 [Bacteroidota bacterium]
MVLALLVMLAVTTKAQPVPLDTYTHQLLFNIFKEAPDPSVMDFLKLYAPSLYNKKANLQPGSAIGQNNHAYEIHSFVFYKHPYFGPSFTFGKLELDCQRFPEPKGLQVYDAKLWFEFDTQQEAEIAYSKLMETFIPISTNKKFSSTNGYQKGEFTDTKGEKGFNKVQIRLMADNLDHSRFKILLELGNNL